MQGRRKRILNNDLTFKTLTEQYLKQDPEELMAAHGKSFYFASMIFSKERLTKITKLYKLCRFIDDCADELEKDESQLAITSLINDLEHPQNTTQFNQLVSEVENWGVKRSYLKELIIGAQFDAHQGEIKTTRDLLLYCYRVAGVVGLMMCPLIGVKNKKAYPHAIDLGLGMQLTNICRDILEDAQMNRTYIPDSELENISIEVLQKQGDTPEEIKKLTAQLLEKADQYYVSAYQGLSYIPLRPRLVIMLAGEIYRHIGVKIRKNNFNVLQGRTYLTINEKVFVSFKTLIKLGIVFFKTPKIHKKDLHTLIQDLPEAHK